jgi:biopolymer transport protein ExbB
MRQGIIARVSLAAVLVLLATAASAQTSGAPPVCAAGSSACQAPPLLMEPGSGELGWREAWAYGGWVMWVLAGFALAGAGIVFRLLGALREARVVPRGLQTELLDRIRAGELSEARRLCEDRPCLLSTIALKTFDYLRQAPRAGTMLLRETVQAEAARQADVLQSQVQLLRDIGVLALLLGVLGFVLGLLRVFGPVAEDATGLRAVLQGGGVMQALVTIAFALFVAIPALACHAWMRRRGTRRAAALQSAAAEVAMAVGNKFDR